MLPSVAQSINIAPHVAILVHMGKDIPTGTVHDEIPRDLVRVLNSDSKMLAAWNNITPLARNEFICWVIDAKKPETRTRRILVAQDKLRRGERRPCCWLGCTHRTDKPLSPSVKGILEKRRQIPL